MTNLIDKYFEGRWLKPMALLIAGAVFGALIQAYL